MALQGAHQGGPLQTLGGLGVGDRLARLTRGWERPQRAPDKLGDPVRLSSHGAPVPPVVWARQQEGVQGRPQPRLHQDIALAPVPDPRWWSHRVHSGERDGAGVRARRPRVSKGKVSGIGKTNPYNNM